jgi:tetratricopeptide (TPR) repeat protein
MKKLFVIVAILSAVPGIVRATVNTNSPGYSDYQTGIGYYETQKFLLSIGAFKKAIGAGMNDPEVYFYLGNAYLNNQDYAKSIDSYQKAFENSLKIDFQAAVIHNMAYAFYLEKDFTNAIKYFNHAYSLDGRLNQTFWFKGMAYYQLRNREGVIREWESYLTAAPVGEQSDNIRAALAIIKATNFTFPPVAGANGTDSTNSTTTINANNVIVNGTDGNGGLIDITGVLQNVEPEDRGVVEDTDIQDIDM